MLSQHRASPHVTSDVQLLAQPLLWPHHRHIMKCQCWANATQCRGVYKDQLHSSRRHRNPSFRPGSNATSALFFTFRVFGLRGGWHPVQISKQRFLKVNFNCEWHDTGQIQSGGKPLPPAAVRSLGSSYHACGFIQKASLFLTWHSATQWPSSVFWIFYQFMERGRKLNLG